MSATASDLSGGAYQYTKLSANAARMTYTDIEGYSGTIAITFTSATAGTFRNDFTGEDSGYTSGTFQITDWEAVFAETKWYSGAADLGGDWRWFDWLGSFNVAHDPWIFHAQHGWLFPFADGPESVYFWDGEMESFLWTSEDVYPSMYRFSDGSWIFYQKGTENPRDFVDLATGIWEQW